ncbi:MAG: tRNA (N6-threonylcarbamoyladenosine(37)-N6)-methyltransferase TrmO [Chloroflexota bacterium]
MKLVLAPIGIVRNGIDELHGQSWAEVVSQIELKPELEAALDGIEGFSHIVVVFWCHRVQGEFPTNVHPCRRQDLPLVGVFASRSPHRPNSIGLTTVRLSKKEGRVLHVQGLDAVEGTPVLDIKPYSPRYNPLHASVPEWMEKLSPHSRP